MKERLSPKSIKAYKKQKKFFKEAYEFGDYGWPEKGATPEVNHFLKRFIKHRQGETMLDIGCGEGRHSIFFAKEGFRVTAIDIEPLALKKAKAAAKFASVSNSICFLKADVFALPFSKGKFDVVLDYGVFHHLRKRDWEVYLSNILKVIKPDGYFMLSIFGKGFKHYMGEKRLRNWLLRRDRYDRFFSRREIKKLFQPFFDIVAVEEISGNKNFIHVLMQRRLKLGARDD